MYCLIFKFSVCSCLSKKKKQPFCYKFVTSHRNTYNVYALFTPSVVDYSGLSYTMHFPSDLLKTQAKFPSAPLNKELVLFPSVLFA